MDNQVISDRSTVRASSVRARRDIADAMRVLRTIKQIKDGTYKTRKGGIYGNCLIRRTLRPAGYKLLREVELQKAENLELLKYVNGERFRFDYKCRPCKGDKQFVIHMPSVFHEAIAGKLNTMIVRWLGKIEDGVLCNVESSKSETMKFASEISSTLATTVNCNEPRDDRLEPDLSFTYKGCGTADLVVEIAWSQRDLNLPDRARRYVTGMGGEIQTVIGFNMNDIYHGGCGATFSIWKAEQDGDKWRSNTVVDNQKFIDENGDVINDCNLSLSLKHFICAKKTNKFGGVEDVPLEMPSTKLYEFYKYAVTQQMMADATKGIKEV
ncbi:hypothetical protein GGS24DRAFT_499258 [Hypoxylon argillaceum]|nr:hypothetical protein GGS24DRAFT_499258 [Hypoxylon argillaceum]